MLHRGVAGGGANFRGQDSCVSNREMVSVISGGGKTEEPHLIPPFPLRGENRDKLMPKATKGDVGSPLRGQYLGQRTVSHC